MRLVLEPIGVSSSRERLRFVEATLTGRPIPSGIREAVDLSPR
jgi:hypothetical protein